MGLGWSDARRAAYHAGEPLAHVDLPAAAALGRWLAAPLVAADDLPRFDNAAMDGYAVRGPGPWRLVGTTRAGQPPAGRLAEGEAWEVATGAPVPAGATGVLPYELAEVSEDKVAGEVGAAHLRFRGEEAAAGEQVLPPGVRVTPQVVALAAAVGADTLSVTPAPTVAAVVTGDEIGTGPGQVRDALGPALPGWVAWAGGTLRGSTTVPDGAGPLLGALGAADADLVLVTGSSSVGPEDHLRSVLSSAGAVAVVDGVDCRPGSLAGLWRLPGGRLVAGLPGNPFAALVAFLTLAAPALAALGGGPLAPLATAEAALPRHRSAARLVPVRLTPDGPVAVGHDRSGMLRGVAQADALAVVPPSGTTVTLHPLPS